jgi:hypothetical protein
MLDLDAIINMHIPAGFLGILSSATPNLHYLSVGWNVTSLIQPSTEVTFDEVVEFTAEMPHLVTLFIPWLFSDHWQNSSTMTRSDSSARSSADNDDIDNKEVGTAKPCLQALGFPCFALPETEDYILPDIKSIFPSLEKLYVFSGFQRSWEEMCDFHDELGVTIQGHWTLYEYAS